MSREQALALPRTSGSEAFAGQSRLERRRSVNAALGDPMKERVHALAIRATAPGE